MFNNIIQTMFVVIVLLLIVGGNSQSGDYNHNSYSNSLNQTWMTNLGDGIPLKQLTILGTQSSLYLPSWWDVSFVAQTLPLATQLNSGIRLFDVKCRHYYDGFPIHNGIIYLDVYFSDVITTMKNWLASFPGQTIIVRITHEYKDSGNTRTFDQTLEAYIASFSSVIWKPTSQNPLLGEVRNKIVILQAFTSNNTYGLLESDFIVEPHRYHITNWYLYDKWLLVKAALNTANTSTLPYLTFWTGYGGSFQYFIASGKIYFTNSANRVATGLSTPLFKSSYPDFPRVVCLWGMCSIVFEGLNILGSSFIANNAITKAGWVFVNFPGDQLIERFVNMNYLKYGVCTATQTNGGCTVCSSAGICLGCDTIKNYAYDNTTSTCIAAANYYLAAPQPLLCLTAMFGCVNCSSSTVCTSCNSTLNYALDAITKKCIAAPGYYLDSTTNSSIACNLTLTGCTACTSSTVCTQCNSLISYILDPTSCICDATAFFVDAGSPPVCVCQVGYYQNGTSCAAYGGCPSSACLTCTNGPMCDLCDTTKFFEVDNTTGLCICQSGYYYDGSACQACGTALMGCSVCSSATVCLSCLSTFQLVLPNCVCPRGTFLDTSGAAPVCSNCSVGCLDCTSATNCLACNTSSNLQLLANSTCDCLTGYYLQVATQICQLCSYMAGCLACSTSGCSSCDTALTFNLNATTNLCDCNVGYYINPYKKCSICVMFGCVDCSAVDVCRVCTTGFTLNPATQQCDEICGDGILFVLPCDDGNAIDGDGCSSTCQVETNYSCVGGDATFRSVCSYNQPIQMDLVSSLKQPLSNSIKMSFTLKPPLSDLNSLNFSSLITSNFSGTETITFTYDGKGNLEAAITYNQSIEQQAIQLTFTPPYSAAFYSTPPTVVDFSVESFDNQGVYFFPPQIYNLQTILDPIMSAMGYAFLGLTLLSMPFGRLIPLQMVGVAQIAYLGLMCIENLQPLLIPFKKLFPVNGINSLFGTPAQVSSTLSSRFTAIGLSSSYLQNLNYMLIYMVLPLIVGLVLFVISKVIKKDNEKWVRWWKKAVGEWFWAGLLMMLYYSTTCLLLQVGYSQTQGTQFYVGAVVGGLILAAQITMSVLYCMQRAKMGEFRKSFKDEKFAQKYYLYISCNKLVLISLVVLLNKLSALSYVMLVLPVLTIILLGIFRPYLKPYNNYRAIFNEICLLLILVCYSYYRLQISSTNTVSTFGLYLPLGIAGLLVLVMLVNMVILVKQFKDSFGKKKQQAKEIESDQTYRSMEMEMMKQLRAKLNIDINTETPGARFNKRTGRVLLRQKAVVQTPNRPDDSYCLEEQQEIEIPAKYTQLTQLKALPPKRKQPVQFVFQEGQQLTNQEQHHIKNQFDGI